MNNIYIHGLGAISPQHTLDGSSFLDELMETDQGYLTCVEPTYKEYIPPRMARRMSRVIKMSVASARMSLDDAGIDVPQAIITGTGLGCLQDTEKFLTGMIDNEEERLNPTAFMQSTHNTIGAQIALLLKCYEYNYTYVHRGFSFENALQDGILQLAEGEHDNVLVGGFDEFVENVYAITKRVGYWKDETMSNLDILTSQTKGAIPGEGATFITLSNQAETCEGDPPYGKLKGLRTIYKPEDMEEVSENLDRLLTQENLSLDDIDLVVMPYNGDCDDDSFSRKLHHKFFSNVPQAYYKHLCGEYHTASAFGLWLSAKLLYQQQLPNVIKAESYAKQELNNILLYNNYRQRHHSFMLVGKA